jgi:hypothetical protein
MDKKGILCRSVDWIDLAQYRDQWRALVNILGNIRVAVPWKKM